VVTGGPGTGKTTILKTALEKMENVALVAPTGKAARRMADVTERSTSTIHRILAPQIDEFTGTFDFGYGPHNPLPHANIIVDESSMMDAWIAGKLLEAIDTARTSMHFLGDVNQLPSVGPGYILGDLIRSGRVPVTRLTEVHRAAQGSWICMNAPKILEGRMDLVSTKDFRFHSISDLDTLKAAVRKLVVETMPAAGVKDIQLLTPQNPGPIGVEALNVALQALKNPLRDGEQHIEVTADRGGTKYKIHEGDSVIQTYNDYDLIVFNGETGEVDQVAHDGSWLEVAFGDRIVRYERAQVWEGLRLAYALTIHKAQGSEWDWVVVICHSAHKHMWTRQLLYTALTRAKKGVVVVGNRSGVESALSTVELARRTALYPFLKDGHV
jgi:exodeoxyribonuclease V alpha subunit